MLKRINTEHYQFFIGGKWCNSVSHQYYNVVSPATGEIISQGSDGDDRDTKKAIHAAYHAFKTWSRISATERSNYLLQISELILSNKEEIAHTISTETGKPLREARLEVKSAANCIVWNAEEGKRTYKDAIPSPNDTRRLHTIQQPIGPVAAITPWNYPLSLMARKIAPALAAGCTVVLKSDSQTPGSVAAFFKIVEKANIPDGVLNFVTGESATIEDALIKDDRIKKITYTGSSLAGHFLIEKAARQVKSVSLNIGNQAPYIVFEDANLEEAVEGVIDIKFRNIHQTFSESNKVFVQKTIKAKFLALLKERLEQLTIGNGLNELVDFGPVANAENLLAIKDHVQDALEKGATLVTGGKQRIIYGHEKGFYFEPTIIDGVNESMCVFNEEVYRPLLPIYTFDTEVEVTEKAKTICDGPALSIFTMDLSRLIRVTNEFGNSTLDVKNTSEIHCLNEFLETKFIAIGM